MANSSVCADITKIGNYGNLLLQKKKEQEVGSTEAIPKAASSKDLLNTAIIQEFKEVALTEYNGDWQKFFLEWREKQEANHKEVIAKLEKANEESEFRYNSLYMQHLKLQQQVQELLDAQNEAKRMLEEKEARKLKRKEAKKRPIREMVSLNDFEFVLNHVTGLTPEITSIRRLALALLYLTGLRVSNLLELKIQHGLDLFSKGQTRIPLIKGGEQRHVLILGGDSRRYLKAFRVDFETIKGKNRKGTDSIFSSPKTPEKPYDAREFDRVLNKILKKAGNKLEKELKTHSFRATFITDLLETTSIHEVKDYVGHRSIATTLEYNRSPLSIPKKHEISKSRRLKKEN